MENKRVLCYVRVSTQEQVNGYSIGEQIDRLRKYCDAHDWIVVNVYTDAGYSGGNTDRPALQQLINDVKSGIGDCVIFSPSVNEIPPFIFILQYIILIVKKNEQIMNNPVF